MSLVIVAMSLKLTTTTFSVTITLVLAAAISDALDGYLARRWGVTSSIGYVMDAMGDRAVHLALVLTMLIRYGVHPLIVWLLVFRDIAIYAVRVLTRDWLQHSRDARWTSLLHAIGVRSWLSMFLCRDAVRLFCHNDLLDNPYYASGQMIVITSSIAFSYWSLYRSLGWVIETEHAAIESS